MVRYLVVLFIFSAVFISCKQTTDDDPDGGTTGEAITFVEQPVMPQTGGYTSGIGFLPSGSMTAVVDQKLYEITTSGVMRLVSADSVHNELFVGPDGTAYTSLWDDGSNIRRYDLASGGYETLALPSRAQSPILKFSAAGDVFLVYVSAQTGRGEMYRSTDKGTTWVTVPTPMQYSFDLTFDASGAIISGGHNNAQHIIARSTDLGATWETLSTHPVNQLGLQFFRASNGDLFTFQGGGSLFSVSRDDGKTFTQITWPTTNPYLHRMVESGGSLYLMAGYPGGNPAGFHRDGGVYKSVDGGTTWSQVFLCAEIRSLALQNNKIAVGSKRGVFVSQGSDWTAIGTGIAETPSDITLDNNGNLMMLVAGTIYRKSGSSWNVCGVPGSAGSIAVNGKGDIAVGTYGTEAIYSSDNGSTWTYAKVGAKTFYIGSPTIMDITVVGNDFYAGIADIIPSGFGGGELIKSIDGGKTYTQIYNDNFTRLLTDGVTMYGVHEYVLGIPQADPMSSANLGVTWVDFTGEYFPLAFNSTKHYLTLDPGFNDYNFHYVTQTGTLVKDYDIVGLPTEGFFVRSIFFGSDDKVYMIAQGSGAAAIKTAIYISDKAVK